MSSSNKSKSESESETEMIMREVCLVNDKNCFSNGTENVAKHLIDTLKIKTNDKNTE